MYFVPKPPADQTNLDWPFRLDRSWLLSGLGVSTQTIRVIGGVLALVVVIGFVVTGIGLLANAGWWMAAGVGSAVVSLLLLGAYVQPLIILGLIIDLFLLSLILLEGGFYGWVGAGLPTTEPEA